MSYPVHQKNMQGIPAQLTAVLDDLSGGFLGDVRADRLHRALYSTDASIFEIEPDLVLLPRTAGDVCKAVSVAGKHRMPITARGGGTGLTGGAVNRGMQLDCSRYLNRILSIDPAQRTAVVEPGVVLDHLNAALKPHGLYFAPDVAPSSRATIGGMIANNSCGAHSVSIGRTVDHVLGLDVVLGDGRMAHFGTHRNKNNVAALQSRAETTIANLLRKHRAEIDERFPKVLRSNGGYGLDRLQAAEVAVNTEAIICGSEGTLGIVTKATVNLLPIPKSRGLVVLSFADLLASLAAVPALLEREPAAIELVDKLILDASRSSSAFKTDDDFIPMNAAAVLVVECDANDMATLNTRLAAIKACAENHTDATHTYVVTASAEQAAVWNMRNAGLGLLMSRPGAEQPYAFVEDSAVPPERLRDYIEEFAHILSDEGVKQAGYYAHASVGCLHVRPVLNLGEPRDVQRMRRVADRISSLALRYGGAMTGEHGDGLLRSEWLAKTYGPELMTAFRKIKNVFDPYGIFNPNKIVDAPAMNTSLRRGYGTLDETRNDDTTLDFSAHGGMLGLTRMCSGVGQCRQTLTGVMCPSYMATRDEKHTTRGRANALRHALTNSHLIKDLSDPLLDEAMDLCLSCKACKSECPTGVDMARLKAEWQFQKYQHHDAPLRARLIAGTPDALRMAQHWPGVANVLMQSRIGRQLADYFVGIDKRVPPPRLASQSFRAWFANRRPASASTSNRPVLYFVDTWTDCITPQVGMALVEILERLNWQVVVPPPLCCGRPAISQGLLDDAQRRLSQVADTLKPFAEEGVPIIASEPSCWSALKDELPQLVHNSAARSIADAIQPADAFVLQQIEAIDERERQALFQSLETRTWNQPQQPSELLLHGHCHQKAMHHTKASLALLQLIAPGSAKEIDSGCCGMAGAFGHEREHYEIARQIGSDRLFPAVDAAPNADVAVTGFSCRHQIEHHTGRQPKHVLELVSAALRAGVRDVLSG